MLVHWCVCLKKMIFLPSIYSPLSWLRVALGRQRPGPEFAPRPPCPALPASPRDLTPTCPRGQRGWERDQRPLGPPQYVVRRGRWGRQRAPWRAECSRRDAMSLLLCNEKQASTHIGLGPLPTPAQPGSSAQEPLQSHSSGTLPLTHSGPSVPSARGWAGLGSAGSCRVQAEACMC